LKYVVESHAPQETQGRPGKNAPDFLPLIRVLVVETRPPTPDDFVCIGVISVEQHFAF